MKVSTDKADLWTWRHSMLILVVWIALHITEKAYKDYLDHHLDVRRTELNVGIDQAKIAAQERQIEALEKQNDTLEEQNTLVWKLLGAKSKSL